MLPDKIKQIISEENESLERHAASEARGLIIQITRCQQQIKDLQEITASLQTELKELEITKLDAASILGD